MTIKKTWWYVSYITTAENRLISEGRGPLELNGEERPKEGEVIDKWTTNGKEFLTKAVNVTTAVKD